MQLPPSSLSLSCVQLARESVAFFLSSIFNFSEAFNWAKNNFQVPLVFNFT